MPDADALRLATDEAVRIRGLSVGLIDGASPILRDVSIDLPLGSVTALVGPSGSGKSTIAKAILGLVRPPLRVTGGTVSIAAQTIDIAAERRSAPRGVSYIPQDPTGSLDPVQTVGSQMKEVFRLHYGAAGSRDWQRHAVNLMEKVGIDSAVERLAQYPHELSGGLKQRVVIAMALISQPRLIVADEPTSALDVVTQQQVMSLLVTLPQKSGSALMLITHEIGLAADYANFVVVLSNGEVVEAGATRSVLAGPKSALTRDLLDVARRRVNGSGIPTTDGTAVRTSLPQNIARVRAVSKTYRRRRHRHRGLAFVDLDVYRGETLAIVGASGSGKSTLGRVLLRLLTPDSGEVSILGEDVLALRGRKRQRVWDIIQPVYQNPDSALDPRWTVERIVGEPLRSRAVRDDEVRARVLGVLGEVGLDAEFAARRPGALSGGQRQRVALARAVVAAPQIIVLDEALSALDLLVQERVLELLRTLQRERGLTFVFISHDLGVVRQFADRVAVMSAGRVVEVGPVTRIYGAPQAPETVALLDSIPGRRGLAADAQSWRTGSDRQVAAAVAS